MLLLIVLFLTLSHLDTILSETRTVYVPDTIGTDEILNITGIVIYPQVLECSRFQYNEPTLSFDQVYDFNTDFDKLSFSCSVLNVSSQLPIFLIVVVNDTNDHAPVFNRDEYRHIREELFCGEISLPTATDPDLDPYNVTVYTLSGGDYGYFMFNPSPPTLISKKKLDRESVADFRFNLTATDEASNLSSLTSVFIEVRDYNDNSPLFLSNRSTYSLSEAQTPGYVLDTFTAHDADTDDNAIITYSFATEVKAFKRQLKVNLPATPLFQINSSTGQVLLTGELDYELFDRLEFSIQAGDAGIPPLYSFIRIYVTILDVLDTIYSIQLLGNLVKDGASIDIPENTIPSFGDLPIIGSSPPLPDNVTSTLALLTRPDNSTMTAPFFLHPVTRNVWSLEMNGTLDRERVSSYQFSLLLLISCDYCNGTISLNTDFSIQVLDENDNAPDLLPLPDGCISVEEEFVGEVGPLSICDKDSGTNAQLSYYLIEEEGDSYFTVNESTGVLFSLRRLDYELMTELEINLMVEDRGIPPLSSNLTRNVCVRNINDNPILFERANYSILLPLNTTLNASLLSLQASDRDGPSLPVYYYINNSDAHFSLNPTTGELHLNTCVTQDLNNTLLPVYASHCIMRSNTSTDCDISHTNISISISISTPPSYPILQPRYSLCLTADTIPLPITSLLTLTHAFMDPGVQIEFQPPILTARGNNVFLSTNISLQQLRDTCADFSCNISLHHSCVANSTQVSTLNVLLTQQPHLTLQFSDSTFQIHTQEGKPANTLLMNLSHHICYTQLSQVTFSTESKLPTILNLTRSGVLTLNTQLDIDLPNSTTLYSFTAHAEADGLTATANVFVIVEPVNDNAPTFLNPPLNVTLNASFSPNQRVAQFNTTDADVGRDGDLTYSLTLEDKFLVIDSATGVLSLSDMAGEVLSNLGINVNQPLHFAHSFPATILVRDNGSLPLNASHSFHVILDKGFMLLREEPVPFYWLPLVLIIALLLLVTVVLILVAVSVVAVCRSKFWFSATFNMDSAKTTRVWDVVENPKVSFEDSPHAPLPPSPDEATPHSSKSSGIGVSIDSSPTHVVPMTDAEIRHIIDSNRELVEQLASAPKLHDFNESSPAPPILEADSDLHLFYEDEASQMSASNGDKRDSDIPPFDIIYANPDKRYLLGNSHSPQSSVSASSSYLSSVSHQRPRLPPFHNRETSKKPQNKLAPLPSSSTPSFSQKVLAHSQQPEHLSSLDGPT